MANTSHYNHDQSTPSTTWTVVHGLDSLTVIIDTVIDYSGAREKILPKNVTIVDSNTIEVTFTNAESGSARVVTK